MSLVPQNEEPEPMPLDAIIGKLQELRATLGGKVPVVVIYDCGCASFEIAEIKQGADYYDHSPRIEIIPNQ